MVSVGWCGAAQKTEAGLVEPPFNDFDDDDDAAGGRSSSPGFEEHFLDLLEALSLRLRSTGAIAAAM
jgi:hypothetical protein